MPDYGNDFLPALASHGFDLTHRMKYARAHYGCVKNHAH
jgi:hypothetical protein